MSKLLKLSNISSFIATATNGVVVKRGETALFDDLVAHKLLASSRKDKEGDPLPYFVEAPEGAKVDFDFTSPAKPADAEQPADTATRVSASRQRRAATQPAV